MSELGSKTRRDLKPDAQAFDKVIIETVPRYKQSGLSGDEWRISASIKFYRKGKLVFEDGCSNVQYACYLLGAKHIKAIDDGLGYFAGEGNLCDQEGCSSPATVTYRKLKNYCRDGHSEEPKFNIPIRMFCDVHKRRGDCGLDDSDSNYEKIDIAPAVSP